MTVLDPAVADLTGRADGRTGRTGRADSAADARSDCCGDAVASLMAPERAACLADLFKALADPTRVRLVGYVASVPGGTVCACHLPERLGISQPTLSHHLKRLVDAGILLREQRGRWAHYTVAPAAFEAARTFLGASDGVPPCC